MTRSKLSGPEKQEIAALFAHQQESIASLAERYQVSASTIRRLLKNLPTPSSKSEETEAVSAEPEEHSVNSASVSKPKPIPKSAKQSPIDVSAESAQEAAFQNPVDPLPSETIVQEIDGAETAPSIAATSSQRPVRRSQLLRKASELESNSESEGLETLPDETFAADPPKSIAKSKSADSLPIPNNLRGSEELSEILQEIGHDSTPPFEDSSLDEEDEDDEDEDDDFDEMGSDSDTESEDFKGFGGSNGLQLRSEALVEVMPFADAILPRICYLVVDRTAELVTRPLKDFGELGQIPEAEVQSRTLPIFDNHRIARRFSHRNQRIIKIPDADMLKKTSTQLSAKGITRLLVNGHIYSL